MKTYPLIDNESDGLRAASGRPLPDITLEDPLFIEDLTIHAETLRLQAGIAREAGYDQLAANLERAAELTGVPNDLVLQIYAMLRPKRASFEDLSGLADHLESAYGAKENAGLLREAAEVYQKRGLLRPA